MLRPAPCTPAAGRMLVVVLHRGNAQPKLAPLSTERTRPTVHVSPNRMERLDRGTQTA
jgi:hypothetical protein